jgi:hypothetical protein
MSRVSVLWRLNRDLINQPRMAGIRGALLQPRVFAVVAISLFIALHLVMSEYSGFQLLLAPQAPAAAPTVVPTPMFSVVSVTVATAERVTHQSSSVCEPREELPACP